MNDFWLVIAFCKKIFIIESNSAVNTSSNSQEITHKTPTLPKTSQNTGLLGLAYSFIGTETKILSFYAKIWVIANPRPSIFYAVQIYAQHAKYLTGKGNLKTFIIHTV